MGPLGPRELNRGGLGFTGSTTPRPITRARKTRPTRPGSPPTSRPGFVLRAPGLATAGGAWGRPQAEPLGDGWSSGRPYGFATPLFSALSRTGLTSAAARGPTEPGKRHHHDRHYGRPVRADLLRTRPSVRTCHAALPSARPIQAIRRTGARLKPSMGTPLCGQHLPQPSPETPFGHPHVGSSPSRLPPSAPGHIRNTTTMHTITYSPAAPDRWRGAPMCGDEPSGVGRSVPVLACSPRVRG